MNGKKTRRLTDCNTLGIDQVTQGSLDQLGKVIRQMLMTDVVEVVIIGVLSHPPVKVRPCQDILQKNQRIDKASRNGHTMASCLFSIVFTAISARK
jgi:hypothetical protein